ncbi:MAG: beta-glucosidase [Anaerolineales bacterium]|nr:beta-glucosidase [Anaerolineales bacterium]
MPDLIFPKDFLWGVSSSAYQIEGAWNGDGKGPSIWDWFSHRRGKTARGETGDVACDHYHRWKDDLDLLKTLGAGAYRFSVSWSRVIPEGRGNINQAGLDFYDRLVDGMLERGIQPFPTLYHFDLPLALHKKGSWPERDTAAAFGEYAAVVAARLGDRVQWWITLNEPMVAAVLGYMYGTHAPGRRNPGSYTRAMHTLLLAHGEAVRAIRSASPRPARVGIALNLSPVHPERDTESDRRAASWFDVLSNHICLDPVLRGAYPPDLWRRFGPFAPPVRDGDLAKIAEPIDFLGVNYYTRQVFAGRWWVPIMGGLMVRSKQGEFSPMWEVYPPGIGETVERVWNDYRPPMILVTENGIPVPDAPDGNGVVSDPERISYLQRHLRVLQSSMAKNIPVKGYFVWSFTDNFEWELGYAMRFGLVYIDFATRKRTPKTSFDWYAAVIRRNGLEDSG